MLPILRSGYMPRLSNELLSSIFDSAADSLCTMPSVNIHENDDAYAIELAAPGFEKADFKVNLERDTLVISGERKQQTEGKGRRRLRQEFRYASFSRSFVLPDDAEPSNVSASYSNGILNVLIPKREDSKRNASRLIDIA
ncbi:MAG: Hsp20/alpha crystallin family protein [Bacteroidales bacterium]|nr:Hsp20/alpha crystallin family protein [Bacteroidales bacterium]